MRACLLAVFCAITCAPALAAGKPVPKYEGKPLEYWVEQFQKADDDLGRRSAAYAIKEFGPDAAPALPTFIEMLADHSLDYRTRVIDMIAAIGPKAKDARPAIVKLVKDKKVSAYYGTEAIVAISPGPKDAATTLVPLLEIESASDTACRALCRIGPDARDAIPAIRQHVLRKLAAKEKVGEAPLGELDELFKLGPDVVPLLVEMLDAHSGCGISEALTCLQALGPKANKAVPSLLELLKHDAAATRMQTVDVLWAIEKHPAVVASLTGLVSTDLNVVYNPVGLPQHPLPIAETAAAFLGNIGPEAKASLPKLREVAAVGLAVALFTGDGNSPFVYKPNGPDGPTYIIAPTKASRPVYSQWQNVESRIRLGRAALQAIDKIEAKPKK